MTENLYSAQSQHEKKQQETQTIFSSSPSLNKKKNVTDIYHPAIFPCKQSVVQECLTFGCGKQADRQDRQG